MLQIKYDLKHKYPILNLNNKSTLKIKFSLEPRFIGTLSTAVRFRLGTEIGIISMSLFCYRYKKMIIIFIKSRKRHHSILFCIYSIKDDIIEMISISNFYFCPWYRNALGPIGSNYSVIIRSNPRGFTLESVCASRRQTSRHFEAQLNLVKRPTTTVLSRNRIRTVNALSCAGINCQLSVINRLPIM